MVNPACLWFLQAVREAGAARAAAAAAEAAARERAREIARHVNRRRLRRSLQAWQQTRQHGLVQRATAERHRDWRARCVR